MKKIILGVATAVVLIALMLSYEIVDTGHRGMLVRFGDVSETALPEGLHFFNPFTSSIYEYNVQQQTWTQKSAIFTSDNQRVDITFAVTFGPSSSDVGFLYKTYGSEQDLINKVVVPAVLGNLQNAIGKVAADELNQRKDIVAQHALDLIRKDLGDKKVIVNDIKFVDTDFSDEYEQAAEQKVKAIQQAQQAKNETVKFEEQAKQTLLMAKSSAEAMRIQTEALQKSKALVDMKAVEKWNGVLPQYIFGGGAMPFIDVAKFGKGATTQ